MRTIASPATARPHIAIMTSDHDIAADEIALGDSSSDDL
jgi:hypothetical protein